MEKIPARRLFIARHYGFCNGVRRALRCVEDLLASDSHRQVCVYHEIVHNTFVVDSLKKRGVNFVDSLDEVPDNAVVVWSAHGVPPELKNAASVRHITAVDATCPRVQKVQQLAAERTAAGDAVIFIGHREHPETVGVLGCGRVWCVSNAEEIAALPDFAPQKIALLTQTTWNSEEVEKLSVLLQRRYLDLQRFSDICYATSERQQAVRDLVEKYAIDTLLVIGSAHSSNSKRLCEVAQQLGAEAFLIDDPAVIDQMDFPAECKLGLTAGASAPDELIKLAENILQNKHNFMLIKE